MNLQGKPFYLSKVQEEWVRHILTGMTAEEKIGQLFVVLGPAYGDEELKQLIKQHHIGGGLYRPSTKENLETAGFQCKYSTAESSQSGRRRLWGQQ